VPCLALALLAAPAVIGMQYLQAAANELLILNKKVWKLLQRSRCSAFFDYPWGRDAPRGSTMVLLCRTMVCSHWLSIQTIVCWPQLVMLVSTGSCDPQFWGTRSGCRGLEMSPLRVVTSCRLLTLTIGLSLTVCTVLRLVTDRQMEGQRELV